MRERISNRSGVTKVTSYSFLHCHEMSSAVVWLLTRTQRYEENNISVSDKTEFDYRLFSLSNFSRAAILDFMTNKTCFTQTNFCSLRKAATV